MIILIIRDKIKNPRFQFSGPVFGESIEFVTIRRKKLSELTPGDVPPGLDPEDVAIDA